MISKKFEPGTVVYYDNEDGVRVYGIVAFERFVDMYEETANKHRDNKNEVRVWASWGGYPVPEFVLEERVQELKVICKHKPKFIKTSMTSKGIETISVCEKCHKELIILGDIRSLIQNDAIRRIQEEELKKVYERVIDDK